MRSVSTCFEMVLNFDRKSKMADGAYHFTADAIDYSQTTNSLSYETNKRTLENDKEDYGSAKKAMYSGELEFKCSEFRICLRAYRASSRTGCVAFL